MNCFVRYYMEARKMDPNNDNRQLIFTSTSMSIAEKGTIDDLKALVEYYQYEWGVILNERTAS